MTYLWRSTIARLASTVLPRSVTSLRMRALSGSRSVILGLGAVAGLTVSGLAVEAVQGFIWN